MEEKNLQETITNYALLIFAILIAFIIYTYFSSNNGKTTQQNAVKTTALQPATNANSMAQLTQKSSYQKHAVSNAETQQPTTEKDTKTTMKPDDYRIPAKDKTKQKLTDLLPENLKNNIQDSLLTEKQVSELSPEERAEYKKTQRQLAKVLRDLGKTEAENQQLKGHISQAKDKSQKLNTQIEAFRGSNK